jgi:hypothetical protein
LPFLQGNCFSLLSSTNASTIELTQTVTLRKRKSPHGCGIFVSAGSGTADRDQGVNLALLGAHWLWPGVIQIGTSTGLAKSAVLAWLAEQEVATAAGEKA